MFRADNTRQRFLPRGRAKRALLKQARNSKTVFCVYDRFKILKVVSTGEGGGVDNY